MSKSWRSVAASATLAAGLFLGSSSGARAQLNGVAPTSGARNAASGYNPAASLPSINQPPLNNALPTGGANRLTNPPVLSPFGFGFGFPGFGGFGGGMDFTSLAATAGWAVGTSLGSSLVNNLLNELWLSGQYSAHGYGTGQPQHVPNAKMMAIMGSAPVGVSNGALLRIDAPKDAKVWVNGKQLTWSDKEGWAYRVPMIAANNAASADIRAKRGEGNYEANRAADVVLRPGDQKSVNFLFGESGAP